MAPMREKVNDGAKAGTFPSRATPLLDSLNDEGPQKLRSMDAGQLNELAGEVRWQTLDAVSVTGGHLGSALGVVELTVALHRVFETPRDEICWDVAHQVYPHKILTGRRGQIYTLRQSGGLSGFAKRTESAYDSFGAGHSATSISAAVGFQVARDLQKQPGHSIAVIGDGAITGGMAFEAMNHAGGINSKMIVILNDNGQVSLPTLYNNVDEPVGALAQTFAKSDTDSLGLSIQNEIARVETSQAFLISRGLRKKGGMHSAGSCGVSGPSTPSTMAPASAVPTLDALEVMTPSTYCDDDEPNISEDGYACVKGAPFQGNGATGNGGLFEQLGFHYVGPIDGHDMHTLVEVLSNLKQAHEQNHITKPIFLHIKTVKGKGYAPAEAARDKLHAVTPNFNAEKKS